MHRKLAALLGAVALGLFLGAPILAQEKTATHQGTVVSVKGNELRMMHPDGKEATHTLAPNATVLCNGKTCKLSDLKPGTPVSVTTPAGNLKTALRVEAKQAEAGNAPAAQQPQNPQGEFQQPNRTLPAQPPQTQQQPEQPQAANRPFLGIRGESAEGGVAIRDVGPNSPAAQAGLKGGDLIQKVNNQPVRDFENLVNALAQFKPGDKVDIHYKRGNEEKDANVTLGQRPAPRVEGSRPRQRTAFLGVATQELTQEQRNRLGIVPEQGARVVEVMANTPAAKAGLENGDVILRVNDKPVNGPMGLTRVIREAGAGNEVTLKVQRGEKTMDLKAHLEGSPTQFFPPAGR